MRKPMVPAMILAASAASLHAEPLISDSFDQAGSQSGSAAPVVYAAFPQSVPNGVVDGALQINAERGESSRILLGMPMGTAEIAAAGGFRLSFDWQPGVDFHGAQLGEYSLQLMLGGKDLINSANRVFNNWAPLGLLIRGNGMTQVLTQGDAIVDREIAPMYRRNATNQLELVVRTNDFSPNAPASYDLLLNGKEAFSGDFTWKVKNDVWLALIAENATARIDNFELAALDRSAIPPAVAPTAASSTQASPPDGEARARVASASGGEALVSDDFAGGQTSVTYAEAPASLAADTAITDGAYLIAPDARIYPDVQLAQSRFASAGGFEIRYTLESGIGFTGSVDGHHGHTVMLGPENILKAEKAGPANKYLSLGLNILGSGRLFAFEGAEAVLTSHELPGFRRGGGNDFRLVVRTRDFAAGSPGEYELFVNDRSVSSGSLNWQTDRQLFFGIAANNHPARLESLYIGSLTE